MPGGRPSGYSTKIAETICEQLAEGRSIRNICSVKGQPSVAMVYRWLDKYEEFRERYARAREHQAESLADDIRDVLADVRNGKLDANAGRMLVDGFKWLAGKLKPKTYGEHLRHSGGDGGPITVKIIDFGKNSPDGQTY